MTEELNRKALIEALSSLPQYDPPASVWEHIERRMAAEELLEGKPLRKGVLPEYDPPEEIWTHVEERLHPGVRMRRLVRRIWPAAAAVLLAAWAVWLWLPTANGTDDVSISYGTETVDPLLLDHNWDEDEEAFTQFYEMCKQRQFICDQPAFQQLRAELEELTQAKEALEQAMGRYGATPEMVLQMKKIELERTDLLKKLMVMLI
ncbi:MAG: hypothetical protein KatS3mg029_0651 [Saprospiraceae bacterium]|nr:MAG: hypothetical protein KatS3mg029_0651 [Saprospiraceae bacterium]